MTATIPDSSLANGARLPHLAPGRRCLLLPFDEHEITIGKPWIQLVDVPDYRTVFLAVR